MSRDSIESAPHECENDSAFAAFGHPPFSGGDVEEAIPDTIPNSEVKLLGADGTAWLTVWESRTPPG